MNELLQSAVLTALLSGGLAAAIPLMFVGLGEQIAERAGVLNIGIEGMMLFGAYWGFVAAYYGNSIWLGFLAGMAGGAALSLIMVLLCIRLGLDQIVVGIAITVASEGVTSVLYYAQLGSTRPRLGAAPTIAIPLLSSIPILGSSVFTQPLAVYLGIVLVMVLGWVFRSTNIGLNIHAAGEKPAALDAAGVSVVATRSWSELAAGALFGLVGAYLSVVTTGVFVRFMTHGEGYIGLVLAMLARGRPVWVLIGAVLFGLSLALQDTLQLARVTIPSDLIFMLPYVVVMLTLVIFARRSYLPPALALPYVRGQR